MKKSVLNFNDLAPDAVTLTAGGKELRLSSLWEQRPLVLAFTRHFGCPQCKELLDELSRARPALDQAGISLAVVTQGQPGEESEAFCAQYAPGILCLCDPQRMLYRAYGLKRGTLLQTVLSPTVWQANARAGKKGFKVQMAPQGQDTMQMAGVFIIGTDGRLRLPYYYDNIADHPPVELLLKGFLGTDWQQPLETPLTPHE